MEERGWEEGKYLIDGFPRSFQNLQGWNEIMGQKAEIWSNSWRFKAEPAPKSRFSRDLEGFRAFWQVDLKCCIFFDCSETVMEAL